MIRILRIAAIIPLLVGALHMALGLGADAMLGARIDPATLADPSLDSQNRFYGAVFTIYGVLLYICTTDLNRYGPVFRMLMVCLFIGGVARIISWLSTGWPAPMIVALWASELILPPLVLLWFRRGLR
jgi:hypothetical protein